MLQVFLGNASETRFLNFESSSAFKSYQVDAQEYLRQHWNNPNSKHGHDYGIEFAAIPKDTEGSNYSLTG